MERHRSVHGGFRYIYEISVPWDGAEIGGKKRAIRNGLVREPRAYLYRPTQHDGLYVAFGAGAKYQNVLHILAPGMIPASVCWTQLGDDDAHEYLIFKKLKGKSRVCGRCWRVVQRERERRERSNGEKVEGSA